MFEKNLKAKFVDLWDSGFYSEFHFPKITKKKRSYSYPQGNGFQVPQLLIS